MAGVAFTLFGIVVGFYAWYQIDTGKSLQWWAGEQVSRDHATLLYWGNVIGAAGAASAAFVLGLLMLFGIML